ncbi:MAG: lysophospholipase [Balneolaceae bacterium]
MKTTLTITDHLGKSLHAKRWDPKSDPAAVIIIVHGLGEHSERYNHFANFLTANGFAVVSYDHRGHGRTDPDQLGFVAEQDGFHLLVKNLRDVTIAVDRMYPNIPKVLFGHSMGSFIVQRFMQLNNYNPKALIYSGSNGRPPLKLYAGILFSSVFEFVYGPETKSPFLEQLIFGAYNKQFKPNRTESDWLSRDPAMVDLYVDDPYCGFICSTSLYHQLLSGIRTIHTHSKFADHDHDIPILLVSGDQDPVSNRGKGVKKLEKTLKKEGVQDVTIHLYPGGRHEMLNEINRNDVYNDILAWLNQHF